VGRDDGKVKWFISQTLNTAVSLLQALQEEGTQEGQVLLPRAMSLPGTCGRPLKNSPVLAHSTKPAMPDPPAWDGVGSPLSSSQNKQKKLKVLATLYQI
jgi:hypothetical protein